jgi:pyrrolidone-carboxylate peptidase
MKLLMTAFEPFGIKGLLSGRNITSEILKEIKKDFPKIDMIILPVDKRCSQIIIQKVNECKPDNIILLGEDPNGFTRIEPFAEKEKRIYSKLAINLKHKLRSWGRNIGTYYCNDVYYQALQLNPNSVFIHLNAYEYEDNLELIKKIIEEVDNGKN